MGPLTMPAPQVDWDALARLDLGGVLDPADAAGGKNRLIDRAQKRALMVHSGPFEGLRVLDFGCGNGRVSEWLVEHGATVHGIDPSPAMVERAREQVPEATFDVLDPRSPKVGDAYDIALTVGVLGFLPERELVGALSTMRGSLRPGGRVVALEKVSAGAPGRGWTLDHYRRCFTEAGLTIGDWHIVRLGFSSILGLVSKWPRLAGLPLLPFLVELEAKRNIDKALTGGNYADYVFVARPSADAATPTI